MSLPVVSLLGSLPTRSLLAWDRKLFSERHHITVLVTSVDGMYPLLKLDESRRMSEPPRFRVGVTARYKPSGTVSGDSTTNFTAFDDYTNLQPFDMTAVLEDLLNGDFMSILQLRIKYQLSWAGAELLHFQLGQLLPSATPPFVASILESLYAVSGNPVGSTILNNFWQHIAYAEQEEACIMAPYQTPLDLSAVQNILHQQDINLPLVAFIYVFRRLLVCSSK